MSDCTSEPVRNGPDPGGRDQDCTASEAHDVNANRQPVSSQRTSHCVACHRRIVPEVAGVVQAAAPGPLRYTMHASAEQRDETADKEEDAANAKADSGCSLHRRDSSRSASR